MAGNEVNFPRGGIKYSGASENTPPFAKRSSQPKTTKSRKRKRDLSPTAGNDVQTVDLVSTTADVITYKTILSDMLVLGCLRNITPLSIEVELPGKLSGKVKINSISKHYTKLLEEELANEEVDEAKDVHRLKTMFVPGQFVPTKIIHVSLHQRGNKVDLSMDPEHINSDLSHTNFEEGFVVWASVLCQLDHGYQLDAGVHSSRIFLPNENIEEGTVLLTGQPLWCVVRKSDITSTASTATVSILDKHMSVAIQSKIVNLHHLTPGMQFNFTISKAIKSGLQGEFMDGSVGYINEAYLAKPMDKLSKYKNGQVVKAWLLYLQPTTKLAYFSMRSLKIAPAKELTIGDKVQSEIVARFRNGMGLKLPNNNKGFITYKRLMRTLSRTNNINDAIQNKYPHGSTHQCRIIDYINIEQVYICTFEESILKIEKFSMNDVTLGELVSVKITGITKEGLLVKLENVNAFIQNIHLSNVAYSENIKKKFSVGQNIQARVFNIDHRGVYLTLKQELINADVCLCTYADAVVNQQYLGVVVNISSAGVLVAYFGGVRGMVTTRYLGEDYNTNMFYVGQVIRTTVKQVKGNRMFLSLNIPKSPKHQQAMSTDKPVEDDQKQTSLNIPKLANPKKIHMGQYVDAIVTKKIRKKGLEVEVGTNKIQAFIPMAHLSSTLHLVPLLLNTYKRGDTIEDLLCVAKHKLPILSKREGTAFKNQNMQVSEFKELKVGSIIRCSYESRDESGVLHLSAPFKSNTVVLKIEKEEYRDMKGRKPLNFEPQQAIVAKVIELKSDSNIPHFTAKLSIVWDHTYMYSIDLLKQNLEDIQRIRIHLLRQGLPIAKLLLGQHIRGVITNISDTGYSLRLPKNINGVVSIKHCSKSYVVGQNVNGVVLWVDYKENVVEISLLKEIVKKVKVQDGVLLKKSIKQTVRADLLIENPKYVVAVIRDKAENGQLIFLPSIFHENAFNKVINYDEQLHKLSVVLCGKVDTMLVGMDKSFIRICRKKIKRETQKEKETSNLHSKIARRLKDEHSISDYLDGDDSNSDQETESEDEDENPTDEEASDVENEEKDNSTSLEDASDSEESEDEIKENSSEEELLSDDEESESGTEYVAPTKGISASQTKTQTKKATKRKPEESDDESETEDVTDRKKLTIKQKKTNGISASQTKTQTKKAIKGKPEESDDESETEDVSDRNILTIKQKKTNGIDASQTKKAAKRKLEKTEVVSEQNMNGTAVKKIKKSTQSISLPGVKNFFNLEDTKNVHFNDDSSDDDIDEVQEKEEKKKKKLTPAERKELERLKEEELSRIERENADSTAEPQTVEQFQKLVKGKPNCSESWTKYITHLVSSGEIEKAKTVAQEALKTIDFKLTQERYNIWIVLLNLENSYGDKHTFNEIFEEAVRCNDDLSIYLAVIRILAESHKFSEMEEKIQKAKGKFKQLPKMWIDIGRIYYENKQFKEARNLKDGALRTIKAKGQHVDLISQFALMEFQYGEKNHGEALFETVLQHNPKRVDVWCSYVDQVIKKGDVDIARGILERSVTQSIPAKKLRTLYQKFKDFETQHGSKENVQRVVDLARKYAGLA